MISKLQYLLEVIRNYFIMHEYEKAAGVGWGCRRCFDMFLAVTLSRLGIICSYCDSKLTAVAVYRGNQAATFSVRLHDMRKICNKWTDIKMY